MKNLSTISIILFLLSVKSLLSQTDIQNIILKTDIFLKENVKNGSVDYIEIKKNSAKLVELVKLFENADLRESQSNNIQKSFWINAYNLTTIKSVVENYPISSPLKVSGFFNSKKHTIANMTLTLDEIEKQKLLPIDQDPRIHFAINCAAVGCPKLISEAYHPETLNSQLEERAKSVCNNDYYVRVNDEEKSIYLNEIFKWYKSDFLRDSKNIIEFLNKYRTKKIPGNYSSKYINYDWKLNILAATQFRDDGKKEISLQDFTPSALLLTGQTEIKIFNNLYTQTSFYNKDSEEINQKGRSTYNTILTSFLYGMSESINIGFDIWLKSVTNSSENDSPLDVFSFENSTSSRTAISSIGPKIKFTPFSEGIFDGFSIQSSFLIPVASNLEGSSKQPFLDFDSYLWLNQFYYDKSISNEFSFFGELDTWFRIDRNLKGKSNSLQIPVKGFLSYYLSNNVTFYGMAEFSYKFGEGDNTSFYSQAGIGAKYQILSGIELEGLITNFYIGRNAGAGSTYNLGIRIVQ